MSVILAMHDLIFHVSFEQIIVSGVLNLMDLCNIFILIYTLCFVLLRKTDPVT